MISAHQNMPEITVNYFCVENNYFTVALCVIVNIIESHGKVGVNLK